MATERKSDQIRQLLAGADRALSAEEIHAQIGGEPGDEQKTSAILTFLRSKVDAEIVGKRGVVAYWAEPGRKVALPDGVAPADKKVAAPPAPPQQPKTTRARLAKPARGRKAKAKPPARKRIKRTTRTAVVVARTAAPLVVPPGSVAVADDGTVMLLEGDIVVQRLTPQQVRNIAALMARFAPAR